MAFTLSGSTITQTGTDTSLAGLSGIAGVTTTTQGTKKDYNLGNLRLVINGTLTMNPEIERLIGGGYGHSWLVLGATAIFTIDGRVIRNGVTTYSVSEAIRNTAVLPDYPNSWISDAVGATLNWYGGSIYADSRTFLTNTNINIENAIYDGGTAGIPKRFALGNGTVSIDGFKLIHNYFDVSANLINITKLEGLDIIGTQTQSAIIQEAKGEVNKLVLNNYKSTAAWTDLGGWTNGLPNFIEAINNEKGSNVTIGTPFNDTQFVLTIYSELDVTVKNVAGATIDGAKLYIKDYNDGNRQNANGKDFTADIVYSATSTAGVFPKQKILIATFNGGVNSASLSYRSKNLNNTDIFDVFVIDYGYVISSFEQSLKGIDTKTYEAVLIPDINITESDKNIVAAYTQIDTTDKLYDRAKAYLVDNYAGETETIITRTGDTIDAGSYNVTILQSGSVFDFDGTTITINATVFTGNITTTGIITDSANAVNGGLIDSVADSYFDFTSEWEIYSNLVDRNASANALGSGTAQENFRFNYVPNVQYYIWHGGTKQTIEATQTGLNIIDLSLSGQLTELANGQTTIKDNLTIVNDGVKKASLIIPHSTDLNI